MRKGHFLENVPHGCITIAGIEGLRCDTGGQGDAGLAGGARFGFGGGQQSRADAPALLRTLVSNGVDLVEARWVGGELEKFYLEQTAHPGGTHAG